MVIFHIQIITTASTSYTQLLRGPYRVFIFTDDANIRQQALDGFVAKILMDYLFKVCRYLEANFLTIATAHFPHNLHDSA